ncbi:MAG: LuxR C-terminal-related transcriptional regulator [Oleiphilus sp.]
MDILLIDDHPVFASGLKELIRTAFPELEVRTCISLEEAKRILRSDSCRLALLDLDLAGHCSLNHISSLVSLTSLQTLCVLSASDDIEKIESCIFAGASGFISKNYSPDLVLSALKSVLEGGVFIPGDAFGSIMSSLRELKRKNNSGVLEELTERQKEVVGLICKGLSNKEIANELGISEGTTKLHVSNIFSLVDVSKRSELIVKFGKTA